jgi:hypothetical protein
LQHHLGLALSNIWAWLWVFTLQHLGSALSLYLAASVLGFESLPCSIWAWRWVFTLQHLGWIWVFTLQHLGLALSLYLAASGLGFESLPCSIWAWLWIFILQHHLGLALSSIWACLWVFTLQHHLGLALSLYLAASGLGFERAEKGTTLWHEVIVSRLVQQIPTLVTRPARGKFEHASAPAKGTSEPQIVLTSIFIEIEKEGSVFYLLHFFLSNWILIKEDPELRSKNSRLDASRPDTVLYVTDPDPELFAYQFLIQLGGSYTLTMDLRRKVVDSFVNMVADNFKR